MICKILIMSGAGNIFSAYDNRKSNLKNNFFIENASRFCYLEDIKTEGLFVINMSEQGCDFAAEFFNPDGSYGAMCGNGGRCAVQFASQIGMLKNNPKKINFTMAGKNYSAEKYADLISLFFPKPLVNCIEKTVDVDDKVIKGYYSDVGADHFVFPASVINLNQDNFYDENIHEFCRKIRFHELFSPRGVNVNVFLISGNEVLLRTYERGVEAQTGACGTGAVSTALTVTNKFGLNYPVKIIPPSRRELVVNYLGDDPLNPDEMILTGDAIIVKETEVII